MKKKPKKTEIAIVDNRYPVTIALSHAFDQGKVNLELENTLRADLKDLVVEVAEKFVGFKNIESVQEALETTLGILSLAVAESTKGAKKPESWSRYILDQGLKTVARDAIAMVKDVADRPVFSNFQREKQWESLRDILIRFATFKSEKNKDVWIGYREYLSRIQSIQHCIVEEKLFAFLIQESGFSQERWLEAYSASNYGEEPDALIDEALNSLLFRFCTGLPFKINFALAKSDFESVRASFEAGKSSWMKKAQDQYKDLVKKIPKELHEGLMWRGVDWFERNLSKGPVKVPKSWKNPPIKGVNGIFWYV